MRPYCTRKYVISYGIFPAREKITLRGASPPKFFEPLFLLNYPTRSKHTIGKLSKHILLAHNESVLRNILLI